MANELRYPDTPGFSSTALVAVNASGQYFRTDTQVYEDFDAANAALYEITLTDPTGRGRYEGDLPTGLNPASVDMAEIWHPPSTFPFARLTDGLPLVTNAAFPVVRNAYAVYSTSNDIATPTAQTFNYPQGSLGRVAAFLPAVTGSVRFLEEVGPTLTILNPDSTTFATGYDTPIPAFFQGDPSDTIQVWRNVDTTNLAVTSGTPYTCLFLCTYMGNDGQPQTQTLLALLYVSAP